ncbi:MAG: DUF4358 domain-containing protein [Ruminococcaceae bacterium]|nr:DUF4358 domain-containing protein [Oscillospiraceae bacterium]
MKRIFAIFLLCIILLVSCGKSTENTNYKTDITVEKITQKIFETAENIPLTKADEGYVALNIPIEISLAEEFEIYISTTSNANLIGVFKATSEENADKLLTQSQEYLQSLEDNWMSDYLPEELPKIQNAVCKKFGLYVTFIVLDDASRDNAISDVENMLKK